MTALSSSDTDQVQGTLQAPARWPASLALEFDGSTGKTVLGRSRHQGPLYVQKAFYPEGPDCAHIYLLHPPGGIVSGDTLDVSLKLKSRAQVLLTTPGATRLYRARQDQPGCAPLPQRVLNRVSVSDQSCTEWLPGETIVFDGASIDLSTDIHLGEGSRLCGWEITCLGLPASNEPFRSGRFSQSFTVTQNGVPKVMDRMAFNADSSYLSSRCGMQGKPVFGTFIAGPFEKDCEQSVESLRQLIEQQEAQPKFAVTTLNGFIILRYLGECSDEARQLFIHAWKNLRPCLIGRVAVEPRIWAT